MIRFQYSAGTDSGGARMPRGFTRAVLVFRSARLQTELILISAGFDAHRARPIGGSLRLGTQRISHGLTARICDLADELCDNRIVGPVLEGGYDLDALALLLPTACRHFLMQRGGNDLAPRQDLRDILKPRFLQGSAMGDPVGRHRRCSTRISRFHHRQDHER